MMTETKKYALYVHIPFCKRKCAYCDFCSFSETAEQRAEYIKKLSSEIEEYKGEGLVLDTVFFGGGTPSILTPREFSEIVKAIGDSFKISEGAEFTVECNPKTLTPEKLKTYKKLGVNRLSIGLQSIHENELKILGRIHNFDDFLVSYNLARAAGFDNINIDLMYGIPEQTVASFDETLGKIIALSPEHISAYGLIIEEGTPIYEKRSALKFPTEDEECEMYYLAAKKLKAAGYRHYEISNYAKSGKLCRHNLKYWNNEEYIGVGAAAHSYFKGVRYSNSSDFSEYLAAACVAQREVDGEREPTDPFEYAMLKLRLDEGISLAEYRKLFGESFEAGKESALARFCEAGLMKRDAYRIYLTEKGFYLSNSVLSEIL